MRIAVVGKYPPIQGGVSRENFWDCHALSSAGHDVHVITNAPEVEASCRIQEELYADQPITDPRLGSTVRVHTVRQQPELLSYFPYANPFVSKLAGKTAQVVDEHGPFDLIYAHYLEPYGVAAQLAAQWTGTPFGLRHSGSDIGRLYHHDGLRTTYAHAARQADFWLAPGVTRRGLQHLGVPGDRIYSMGAHSLPTDYFNPLAVPLLFGSVPVSHFSHRPELPTIGIYGKVSRRKGQEDLLHACASAGPCNLVIVTSGPEEELERLLSLADRLDIRDRLTVLPFMPHWQIPSFIAACDAVAFLEHDFPISIHHPLVPREILACAGCLILSGEVADYQSYSDQLCDRKNYLRVDPRDRAGLAAAMRFVIENQGAAREIGRAGYLDISQSLEDWHSHVRSISGNFEQIVEDVTWRRNEMTVAETQAALSRLYVDDAFRNWFALAPSDALESYALTPAEREALASIDGKMLALFAANLREKRATKILTSYPLCRALFKDELTRYFERYYELHPAHPGESSADQIVSFGRFLAGSLVGSPDAPPCAVDLCRYELAINEVRLTFWPIDDLHAIMAPDEPGPTGEYPKLAPGVKVMSFDYDIPDIARCIEEGTSGGPAQPSRTHVTIKPVARSAPGVFRVNEITASLLALCDGDRSLDEIARDLGQDVGREALVGVLARMRDNGLVSKSWGE